MTASGSPSAPSPPEPDPFAGTVAIVTGASRGIGRATAQLLAHRGTRVVCVGRDRAALNGVAGPIAGSFVVADARDPDGPERIVEHTLGEYGRLDAVVANAGVGYTGGLAGMPAAQITELVEVNLLAPILLTRASLRALRQGDSRRPRTIRGIVLVSSIAGAVGVPGEAVYSATKAALDSLAAVMREELRPDGISVSTVTAGVVDTDFLRLRAAPYARRFPRPVPPERVAAAVVTLLETRADRIFEPRWLVIPARLAAHSPRLYRALARRFG